MGHATESVNKMLIGNKCDMVDKKVIETERGQQLADEYSIKFMETSAKNSINVDQAFITLAQDIKKRLIDTDGPGPGPTPKGDVKLDAKRRTAVEKIVLVKQSTDFNNTFFYCC